MAAARAVVEQVLNEFDVACSRFREDSELSRINAARGRWTAVSPLLMEALEAALWAARTTGGLVDPTVGGALRSIGYDRDFEAIERDLEAPIRLTSVAGWQALELDRERYLARLPAGVELDLGATGKGLAADRAAAAAAQAGGTGVLVSLGGDIAVAGDAPEGGWIVLVTERNDDNPPAGDMVSIWQGGLATSTTQVRRWQRGGVEVHHIIDPLTARPSVSAWRTVSVVAASCLEANAAATAAILKGTLAPRWLKRLKLPSRLVRTDGSVVRVAGWPRFKARS